MTIAATAESSTREPGRASGLVAGLVLLAAVLGAYAASLGSGFVWDDVPLIAENPALADWSGLPSLLTREVSAISGAAPEGGGGYWRPLTLLTFFVDARFWGTNPFGFHLTNVLLHALVALLLYALLRDLGAGAIAAALGASLHALHPLGTESVAWVSGRTDVLAALLLLGAARIHVRGGPSVAVLALYALAALAKETALAFPAALLALDVAFGARRPLSNRLARLVPFAAVALAVLALRWLAIGSIAPETDPSLSVGTRLLRPVRLLGAYLAKAAFPVSPNAEWEPDVAGPFVFTDAIGVAALALLLAAAVGRRVPPRPVIAAAGVGLAFLIPALGFIGLPETAAERFLYLPLLGVPFLALLSPPLPKAAAAAAAATAVLFLVVTAARVPTWGDPLTLFADSADKSGDHPRALYNLANEHHRRAVAAHDSGDLEGAADHYDRATSLYSRVESLGGPGTEQAILAIGRIEIALGRANEAYETLRQGLDRFPDSFGLWLEMGRVRIILGDEDAALAALRRAIDVHSELGEPYRLLGGLYLKPPRRDLETAARHLERAVELNPSDAEACQMLGSVVAERSRGRDGAALDRALDLFRRAIALNPSDVTSMEGMAKILVYANTGGEERERTARLETARRMLVDAIRIEGRASLYRILSDTSALLGHFDEARHWIRVVIEAEPPDIEAWRARLVEIDVMEREALARKTRPPSQPK